MIRTVLAVAAGTALVGACTSTPTTTPLPATPAASEPSATAEAGTDVIADVPVGDRRLHVTCFGPEGAAPTIVLEAGGALPSDQWDAVADPLSAHWRTCSYDRAGTGASPLAASSGPRTMTDVVGDLEAVLAGAGTAPPYVFVGHSMGLWPESVYADEHPGAVVGVVLVDPRPPHVSDGFRAALPPPRPGEPAAVTSWREDELGAFEHDPDLNPEHLDLTRSAAQAAAALDERGPLFGDAPLVLLSAARPDVPFSDLPPALVARFHRVWVGEQLRLLDESRDSRREVVPATTHDIPAQQPRAVVEAVEQLMTGLTAGRD